MKKYKLILFSFIMLVTGCVQPTRKQVVKITLHVNNMHDIKMAGIRGDGKPLSWNEDLVMKEIIKDSLYQASFTTNTGFRFFEMKFTINGEFELNDKPNRHIRFSDQDTTFYQALLNEENDQHSKAESNNENNSGPVAILDLPFANLLSLKY
ncbi:MAG: hypothetical protein JST02_12735 [Bacteroidetes bacterium]|nr:hypothetical protein [Bacteroidota bacterium]